MVNRPTQTALGLLSCSDIVSYNSFDTRIDVDAMAEDIAATKAIVTSTLTGRSHWVSTLCGSTGEKMMGLLRLADGSAPAFWRRNFLMLTASASPWSWTTGNAGSRGSNPMKRSPLCGEARTQCHLNVPDTLTHCLAMSCCLATPLNQKNEYCDEKPILFSYTVGC